MTTETVYDFFTFPVKVIAWILSLPVRVFSWIVSKIRLRYYDPEKTVCPGCGFRGDSGTAGKSCRVQYIRIESAEKAMIRCTCFRCGCNEIYLKLFVPGDKWLK